MTGIMFCQLKLVGLLLNWVGLSAGGLETGILLAHEIYLNERFHSVFNLCLTYFLLNGEKISHAFIYVTYDLPEYFVPSLMYKLIFS